MKHLTSRNSAERHGNALGRTIVESVDDTKIMQQSKHSLFTDESQDQIEHVHPYGFTNVPKKPTQSGGSQSAGGGGNGGQTGGQSGNQSRMGAESFMTFESGARSHGVALVTGDRRYRLYKLAEGEVALHDDQGHQVHIRRDGVYVSAPNSKKIYAQVMQDDTMPQDQGAKGGQIQQAGRQNVANFQFDKNGLTVNCNSITFNVGTFQVNGTTVANGTTYLGGDSNSATKKVAVKFSVDTAGDLMIKNLASNVFATEGGDD